MKLFNIFLSIAIFNLFTFLMLYLSILEIEVKELKIDTKKKENDFLIYLRLKLLKRITWAKVKIDNNKVEKFKNVNNKIVSKISEDLKEQIKNKKSIANLKLFKVRIKSIDINLKIGLINPVFTSFISVILTTMLSNIVGRNIEKYSKENCRYIIEQVYSNKPQLKLDLNCIIYVKMVHIISIIYMLNLKGSEKNGKFSSNRRAYESLHV